MPKLITRLADQPRNCELNMYTHTHTHTNTCRARFGEDKLHVEQGKKENHSEVVYFISMAEFLDVSPYIGECRI